MSGAKCRSLLPIMMVAFPLCTTTPYSITYHLLFRFSTLWFVCCDSRLCFGLFWSNWVSPCEPRREMIPRKERERLCERSLLLNVCKEGQNILPYRLWLFDLEMVPGTLDDLYRSNRQTPGQSASFLFRLLEIRVARSHQDQDWSLYLGMAGIGSPPSLGEEKFQPSQPTTILEHRPHFFYMLLKNNWARLWVHFLDIGAIQSHTPKRRKEET